MGESVGTPQLGIISESSRFGRLSLAVPPAFLVDRIARSNNFATEPSQPRSSEIRRSVVAKFYPTEIRATGGGYAQGLGRIGSMLSPIIVGWALAVGWKAHQVLLLPVVPACLAAICVVMIGVLRKYAVDDDKGASHNPVSMPINTLSAGHSS